MRSILVLSRHPEPFDAAVDVAAGCAKWLGASLSGLHIVTPATTIALPEVGSLSEQVLDEFDRRVESARRRGVAFERLLAEAGVDSAGWHVASGLMVPVAARFGLWHDLLVLDGAARGDASRLGDVGSLLLGVDLPCLIVPPQHAGPFAPLRIVVAWNGSSESIRALRAARALLGRAERITILVGRPRTTFGDVPLPTPFDLDGYFGRERLTVEHYPLEAPDDRSGVEIVSVATDMQADLLVMGAYGRTRFGEWMLGGATRHALSHAQIPLLMRH